MRRKTWAVVAFLATTFLLTLQVASAQAKGGDTYQSKCAMCHGPNGDASGAMAKNMGLKPLSSPEVQNLSDADLTSLIANGKGKMPAMKGKLTDEQISDLVAYIRSLKK